MSPQAAKNDVVPVSAVDRRGRPISSSVLSAADQISQRAVLHGERLLVDPAVVTNLLEEAAAAVSQALKVKSVNEGSIRNLESYLFRAFLRRLNRYKKRQLRMAHFDRVQAFLSDMSQDPRTALERKIFIDEFLMQCDPRMRDVLCRRLEGCSWKEIGWKYRISSHAAESKFSQALQKVRRKLGLK